MRRIVTLFFLLNCIISLDAQLIISQYIDASSGTSPKGLELWNTSGSDIDFSITNLIIEIQTNANSNWAAQGSITSGVLKSDSVFVIGTSELNLTNIPDECEGTLYQSYNFSFNGDDALRLTLGGIVTDLFGDPSTIDPGTAWTGGGVSTADNNIKLKAGITTGDIDGWTDPSERFEQVAMAPDITNFGVTPIGCALPAPSNNICSAPIELANGVPGSIANESTVGATLSTESDGSCSSSGQGDLFYSVITDSDGVNGELLNISVIPSSSLDVAVYVYDACGMTPLTCADALTIGGTENISLTGVNLRNHKAMYGRDAQPFLVRVEFTGTGTFTISASGTALPITIAEELDLKLINNNQVLLSWSTLSEVNNSHFDLLHSKDGRVYSKIAEISGYGTTSTRQNYKYTHETPSFGENYYQLIQYDYDGQSTAYSPKMIRFHNINNRINVSPTMVNDLINIYGNTLESSYQIFNNLGQLVKQGGNESQINVSDLVAGTYFINIDSQNIRFVKI